MTTYEVLTIGVTATACLLLAASGCDDKGGGGPAVSSATAQSSAASAPAKKEPAALVKELGNPATREAAKRALVDYDWDSVAGGFPPSAKEAIEELLTASADHEAVKATIAVCDEIGTKVSYACDEGLMLLIKKNNLLSSDEAKANRDRACSALSPGRRDNMKEQCP